MTDNIADIKVPGARGKVAVQGLGGVFFKVLIDGEPVKPRGGAFPIPLRNGTTGQLRTRGIIPGFQSLEFAGEKIFRFGAHASIVEKVAVFLPFALIVVNPAIGLVLGVALFFMNIAIVKNVAFPRLLRVALPIVNTVAGGLLIWAVASLATSA